jgi:hypothetical protein
MRTRWLVAAVVAFAALGTVNIGANPATTAHIAAPPGKELVLVKQSAIPTIGTHAIALSAVSDLATLDADASIDRQAYNEAAPTTTTANAAIAGTLQTTQERSGQFAPQLAGTCAQESQIIAAAETVIKKARCGEATELAFGAGWSEVAIVALKARQEEGGLCFGADLVLS